jgi:hypothetical protein
MTGFRTWNRPGGKPGAAPWESGRESRPGGAGCPDLRRRPRSGWAGPAGPLRGERDDPSAGEAVAAGRRAPSLALGAPGRAVGPGSRGRGSGRSPRIAMCGGGVGHRWASVPVPGRIPVAADAQPACQGDRTVAAPVPSSRIPSPPPRTEPLIPRRVSQQATIRKPGHANAVRHSSRKPSLLRRPFR